MTIYFFFLNYSILFLTISTILLNYKLLSCSLIGNLFMMFRNYHSMAKKYFMREPLSNKRKFWTGWNSTKIKTRPNLPIPMPSPTCIILKSSYPFELETSFRSRSASSWLTSEYDSGFYFFDVVDCKTPRPFVCEAELVDFGKNSTSF